MIPVYWAQGKNQPRVEKATLKYYNVLIAYLLFIISLLCFHFSYKSEIKIKWNKIKWFLTHRQFMWYIKSCESNKMVASRPRPIMLKILPIMLWAVLKKLTHYAQYYAHES